MDAALALIGEDLKNVELQFKKDLQSDVPLIRKVGEYVLSSGGKRIRPALLLLSAKLCGYHGDRSVPLASARAHAARSSSPTWPTEPTRASSTTRATCCLACPN